MNQKLRDALAIVEKYGMKGDVIYKEALAKRDAALKACVAALRTYDLIDTQAAAAITQAEGAMK